MKNIITFKNKDQKVIDELLKTSEEASDNYKTTYNQLELKANNGKITEEDAENLMRALVNTGRAATNLEDKLIEVGRLEPKDMEEEKRRVEAARFCRED